MPIKFILLILFITFVTYICIVYSQTRRLINIGIDIRDNTTAYTREIDSPTHILIIGDSSGFGTGASIPEESVAGRLGADINSAHITNLSVNGAKTKELIPRLKNLGNTKFSLILIQIGGNDIVRATNLSELDTSIRTVLTEATARADHVILMTSGDVGTSKLLPFGTRWWFTHRTKQVRDIFLNAASTNDVYYADIFRTRSNDPFAKDPKKYYAADMFHPSSDGYADWYGFVKSIVKTLEL